MLILVRALGVVIVGMASAILFNPKLLKTVMNFWRQDKRIYLAGAIRIVFGTVLLMAAPLCRLSIFIYTLGGLMMIAGLSIFMISPEWIYKMLDWWQTKPPLVARLMGLVALSIGALILYSA